MIAYDNSNMHRAAFHAELYHVYAELDKQLSDLVLFLSVARVCSVPVNEGNCTTL